MSGKRRENRQDAPQPMVAIKMRLEPSSANGIFDMIAHNSAGDAAKCRTTFIQARPLSRACLAGETDEDRAEIGKDLIVYPDSIGERKIACQGKKKRFFWGHDSRRLS